MNWRMTPVGIKGIPFTFILLLCLSSNNILSGLARSLSSQSASSSLLNEELTHPDEGRNKGIPTFSYSNDNEAEERFSMKDRASRKKDDPMGTLNLSDIDPISALDKADATLPDSSSSDLLDNNGISPESRNHLLAKRQVRNEYERFYICLFSLFSNPDCNNRQRQQQNGVNTNFNQGIFNVDSNNNGGYIPLFQPQPQAIQRPGGFLGLGLNGLGQGLGVFNPYPNNNNNFQQQQSNQQQPQLGVGFNPMAQNAYPDPQVNRRPGPPAPESIQQNIGDEIKATISTTTTTTTPKPKSSTTSTISPSDLNEIKDYNSFGQTNPSSRTTSTTTTKSPIPESASMEISATTGSTTNCDHEKTDAPTASTTTEKYSSIKTWDYSTSSSRPSFSQEPLPTVPTATKTTTTTTTTQQPEMTPSNILGIDVPESPSNIEQSEEPEPMPTLVVEDQIFQKLRQLEEESKQLMAQLSTAQEQLLSYQEQTTYLQDALKTVQDEKSKLKQRVAQLERTNNDLQQKNGQLQFATGDQKTRINDLSKKVTYLEDKLVRLSRQNLPLTQELQRHQKEERELNEKIRKLVVENAECRNQIYQLQLKQSQKLVLGGNGAAQDRFKEGVVIGQGQGLEFPLFRIDFDGLDYDGGLQANFDDENVAYADNNNEDNITKSDIDNGSPSVSPGGPIVFEWDAEQSTSPPQAVSEISSTETLSQVSSKVPPSEVTLQQASTEVSSSESELPLQDRSEVPSQASTEVSSSEVVAPQKASTEVSSSEVSPQAGSEMLTKQSASELPPPLLVSELSGSLNEKKEVESNGPEQTGSKGPSSPLSFLLQVPSESAKTKEAASELPSSPLASAASVPLGPLNEAEKAELEMSQEKGPSAPLPSLLQVPPQETGSGVTLTPTVTPVIPVASETSSKSPQPSTETSSLPSIVFDDAISLEPQLDYGLSQQQRNDEETFDQFNINRDQAGSQFPVYENDNLWRFPLFSRLFNQRFNPGYGQNQAYYRSL